MDQIVNLTEEQLMELRENVVGKLLSMRRGVLKGKFKVFGKTVLSLALVAGGVAVAIVFPSPIVLAALGGAAAVFGGSKGAVRDIRNVRKSNTKRRTGKEELLKVEEELTKRKAVREFVVQQNPTAPPLYPGL